MRSASRPVPTGGGWSSIQATIRSGNSRRSSLRVEEELAVRPRHPVRPSMGDVRGHHLEVDALRPQVAEGERAGVVLCREVVDQVREPRRQRGGRASFAARGPSRGRSRCDRRRGGARRRGGGRARCRGRAARARSLPRPRRRRARPTPSRPPARRGRHRGRAPARLPAGSCAMRPLRSGATCPCPSGRDRR